MKLEITWIAACAAALASAFAVGCGADCESTCRSAEETGCGYRWRPRESLDAETLPRLEDCASVCKYLEETSEAIGCTDEFDEYIGCLDDQRDVCADVCGSENRRFAMCRFASCLDHPGVCG
jgi:hypothetical protein